MTNFDSTNPTTPLPLRRLLQLNLLTPLVNPDVINEHLGGELGLRIGGPRPVSTHRQVQYQMKTLVEGGRKRGFVGEPFLLGLPRLAVYGPSDFSFFPNDGKDVEVVGKGPRAKLVFLP